MIILMALITGFICGILSGFGVGGGTLLMIYMVNFTSIVQTAAQGINLVYFLPTSLTALFSHVKNRLIDRSVLIPAIIAGVVSSLISALAATAVDTAILEKFFGVFLLLAGSYEFFKKG